MSLRRVDQIDKGSWVLIPKPPTNAVCYQQVIQVYGYGARVRIKTEHASWDGKASSHLIWLPATWCPPAPTRAKAKRKPRKAVADLQQSG